jgi:hypothetical protein
LTILNGRTKGDIEGNYTFIGPNGSSVIDICLVNSLALEDVTKFEVGSWSLSPHNPIHLSLGRKIHKIQNIYKYQNNFKEYQSRMEPDKLVSYDSLIKSINGVAYSLNMKRTQRTGKPWFDGQCHAKRRRVIEELQISRQNARSPDSCRDYDKERKEYVNSRKNGSYFMMRCYLNANPFLLSKALVTNSWMLSSRRRNYKTYLKNQSLRNFSRTFLKLCITKHPQRNMVK